DTCTPTVAAPRFRACAIPARRTRSRRRRAPRARRGGPAPAPTSPSRWGGRRKKRCCARWQRAQRGGRLVGSPYCARRHTVVHLPIGAKYANSKSSMRKIAPAIHAPIFLMRLLDGRTPGDWNSILARPALRSASHFVGAECIESHLTLT